MALHPPSQQKFEGNKNPDNMNTISIYMCIYRYPVKYKKTYNLKTDREVRQELVCICVNS